MSKAQRGVGHGLNLSRRQLQQLQVRALSRRMECAGAHKTRFRESTLHQSRSAPLDSLQEPAPGFGKRIERLLVGSERIDMRQALPSHDHVRVGTGHGQSTIVHRLIENKCERAIRGARAEPRHSALLVTRYQQMRNVGISFNGGLKEGCSFRAITGAGARYPEYIAY